LINSNDFPSLLHFIRFSTSMSASPSKTFSSQKSLLTICRYLKNQGLDLIALSSLEYICQIV
jgi:hypothetical protein